MDKVYLIIVDNGESYEDHSEVTLGFTETKEKAEAIVRRIEAEVDEDIIKMNKLEETCNICNENNETPKCRDCEVVDKMREIEGKDIYSWCWHVGSGTYDIREINKLF